MSQSLINNNFPAFPRPASKVDGLQGVLEQDGMSMRDWFAGNAITMGQQMAFFVSENYKDPAYVAKKAYDIADAMLAERKRTQEGV